MTTDDDGEDDGDDDEGDDDGDDIDEDDDDDDETRVQPFEVDVIVAADVDQIFVRLTQAASLPRPLESTYDSLAPARR
jgi:hypothetical protein